MVVNYYDVMVKILWVGGIIFIPTEDKNNSAEGRTCKPEGGIIPTIPTGKSHPDYTILLYDTILTFNITPLNWVDLLDVIWTPIRCRKCILGPTASLE